MDKLIAPHGGVLVDLRVPADRAQALHHDALAYPRLRLNPRPLTDLEMLATGALSPLNGFMKRADYLSVRDHMRLTDGCVWPLPITLRVTPEEAKSLAHADHIALFDASEEACAILHVEECFEADLRLEALAVFGTEDPAHPGVKALLRQGSLCLAGSVDVLRMPVAAAFHEYRLEPRQTRERFIAQGWRHVVGFQTRNPIHRAHEYIQKCALELVDGLLLHPLVGETKADDVPAPVRMKTYEVILSHYYPSARSMMAVFPAYMRYAGPREALFHALCRKNYGCSHFIVGRDHAGVGDYYGPYDAQHIFDRFHESELGIKPLFFDHAFYCRRCGGMASAKTCPHGTGERVLLSGTEVRRMLSAGTQPPREFTRPEVAALLIEAYGEAPHQKMRTALQEIKVF